MNTFQQKSEIQVQVVEHIEHDERNVEYIEDGHTSIDHDVDSASPSEPVQCAAADESLTEVIESNHPDTLQQPISATPDADAAVAELNGRYAWINASCEIFRISHKDFIKPYKFHLEHSNFMVEANVGGKLRVIRASSAWLNSPKRRNHDGVVYAPSSPPIVNNRLNLWKGWGCEPQAGDVTPWSELLDFVFADETIHRNWFERWVAYPIQHPGAKLNTATVLWSARQGVGKTLLGQTIGRIYGVENYKEITSNELRGRFNGWTKGCQFVLGEENSGASRLTDSDRLKHLITGETIQVDEKFQPLLNITNCINFMFTSNHANAFLLESFDRRYFVWEIQRQPLPASFYSNFVHWRDNCGGSAALMNHFRLMDLSEFDPKGPAPMTQAKAAMIDASRTELEQWLGRFREDPILALDILGTEVITLEELAEIYTLREKCKARPQEVGRAMHRLGECAKRRVQLGVGNRPMLHAVTRVDFWKDQEGPAWTEEINRKSIPVAVII